MADALTVPVEELDHVGSAAVGFVPGSSRGDASYALEVGSFRELHAFGADDAVSIDDLPWPLEETQKALRVRSRTSGRLPVRGAGVVAHAAVGRRAILGRIMRIAGFDVRFAANARRADRGFLERRSAGTGRRTFRASRGRHVRGSDRA